MEMLGKVNPPESGGYLEGQFLVAMPGMADERFARTVVYVCAHSDEGAMGFIVNQPQDMNFPDLLVQLGIVDEAEAIRLPNETQNLIVQNGGPVDRSRGFVLHSADYMVESSMQVRSDICLTATIDILRDISAGQGPGKAMMVLGYAGWTAGQLENEISQNGWLTCPANASLLFDTDMEHKYEIVLASAGIDPLHLSATAGHA
jgi:putative transcriptional regulator